jgi:hypothetical protein
MTRSGCFGKFETRMFTEDLTDTLEFSDDVNVPIGNYKFHGFKGMFVTPMGYRYYTQIDFDAGSFFDGWRLSLGFTPTWSISADLELSGFYQFNRVSFSDRGQEFTAHIGRLRLSWMLSIATSFSAFVQYNSAADAVIANVRFRYNPREGNDLYIVYDEGFNTDRLHHDPIPPVTGNRTVLLKYKYTFQLSMG